MRRTVRFFVAFICIVMLVLSLCGSAAMAEAAYSQEVADAKTAIVRTVTKLPNGNVSVGTAFAVGSLGQPAQYFITCGHCVEDNPDDVYITISEKRDLIPVKVLAWDNDPGPDFAILKAYEPISTRFPLPMKRVSEMDPTERVTALGFPALSDDYSNEGDSWPSTMDDISITSGQVTKIRHLGNGKKSTAYFIQNNALITGGNSGGPLMTDSGYVVGINSWILRDPESGIPYGYNYSLYIDYAMEAMDKLGITYATEIPEPSPEPTAEPAPVPEPDPTPWGLYIGIGAGVLIIVAAVLAVLLKKQGKSQAQQPAGVASQDRRTMPVKSGETATADAPAPLSIACIAGALMGKSYPLSGTVRIGHSTSRSTIVFPENTPGVSGLHCELRQEGDHAVLIDHSTYGTYLSDKTKLPKNTPYELKKGDIFYLGSVQTGFQLK